MLREWFCWELENWRFARERTAQFTRKHLVIEAFVALATTLATALIELFRHNDWAQAALVGGLTGVATIVAMFGATFLGTAVKAPYALWKEQRDNAHVLSRRLETRRHRVEFDAGNAAEFVYEEQCYMFKVTNNGPDSSNCLVRLNRVRSLQGTKQPDEVLPSKAQWEQERRGPFTLRENESKYIMLIGEFPDGWRFLFESRLSEPILLDAPVTATVSLYGCGPRAEGTFIIDPVNLREGTLRITVVE